ncbi:hypothetical protein ABEH29_10285 [Pantoea agglomerans]|uniref:hypothetical protein n=1 Tax=Enterobacter agglomerans TaxID=549 RepID=UPI00165426A6|nr:hypothetical protein [Pantoea agglomerans]
MSEDLKQAQTLLHITDVHVRQSAFMIASQENFISINRVKKARQSYNSMVKIEEIISSNDDESEKRFNYIFTYAVGLRLVREEEQHAESPDALVVVEAEFDACYLSHSEVTKQQLDAFSQNNVGYHVWPYWRELVQSSCAKSGINHIRVPFYKFLKDKKYILKEDD